MSEIHGIYRPHCQWIPIAKPSWTTMNGLGESECPAGLNMVPISDHRVPVLTTEGVKRNLQDPGREVDC
jgi:hypothetical protein